MTMLVSSSIGAGLFLIAAIGANVSRTRRRRSAQRENPVSGLPNFEALRSQAAFGSATVVAAQENGRASCRDRVCQVRVDIGGRRISKTNNELRATTGTNREPYKKQK